MIPPISRVLPARPGGLAAAVALAAALAGCAGDPTALDAARFVASVPVPAGWTPATAGEATPDVPGVRLAAWRGPDGVAIVAFRTLPDPKPSTPAALAEEWANRHHNLAGITVEERGTTRAGDVELARVAVVRARPTGTIRRVYLAAPRASGTLWLAAIAPTESRAAQDAAVAALLTAWRPPAPGA